MSLINISNLTFAYDTSYDNIFDNVSFQIDTDWKLGFTGRNGRGKTTFLKLLLGDYEYKGSITHSVSFEYFPFAISKENIITTDVVEEICPDYLGWQLLREISLLDLDEEILNRPFNTLSKGEQTKILLASLFLKENSFLLIDEPTNHLDANARDIVSKYLKSKSGFILVSHDRCFLDKSIDHILAINKTNIEVQKGKFSSWLVNKQRQDQFEIAENEKLAGEIKKLKKSAMQSDNWADKAEKVKKGKGSCKIEKSVDSMAYYGEKSRRMQQRRKNLERRQQDAIEEKSGLLKNIETANHLKLVFLKHHSDNLVRLNNVTISYDDKTAVKDVSFEIKQGDRIALCGKNGCGKSSIIKLICGEGMYFTGDFYKASNLKISYVSQDTSYLKGSLTDYAEQCNIDESLFKSILRKLDFSRVQFEKDMQDFSGGQKKKVLIARSLSERAHLYIWDEPLNFIDVISRIQIEDLLMEYKPTILFVEHDMVFCDKIATYKVLLG